MKMSSKNLNPVTVDSLSRAHKRYNKRRSNKAIRRMLKGELR